MNSIIFPKISAFTIVRNASYLNYPLIPSLRSALILCDELVINCGDSIDDTREICIKLQKEFPDKIVIVDSEWDDQNQKDGFQLKKQTNLALSYCRHPWCLYLQSDEVLHEEDLLVIKKAMTKADQNREVDGVLFQYRHFYGDYHHQITGRSWYRNEVRLFKNYREIHSFRDAQGFRKHNKPLCVIDCSAQVFHYGHVRDLEGRTKKQKEMAKWWGEGDKDQTDKYQLYRYWSLKKYKGSHPEVMRDLIQKSQWRFCPEEYPRQWSLAEFKDILTSLWDVFFDFRLFEFRNYQRVNGDLPG